MESVVSKLGVGSFYTGSWLFLNMELVGCFYKTCHNMNCCKVTFRNSVLPLGRAVLGPVEHLRKIQYSVGQCRVVHCSRVEDSFVKC